jgi:hypothetical protein
MQSLTKDGTTSHDLQRFSFRLKFCFGLSTSFRLLWCIFVNLLQILICHQYWGWILGVLDRSVVFHLSHSWKHTNCEPRKAQNPEVSADKICTWPVSRIRIPTHTSALHILLYSYVLFHQTWFATASCLPHQFSFRGDFLGPGRIASGHCEWLPWYLGVLWVVGTYIENVGSGDSYKA